jgi:4-diphosphocytidyl-2-C-methyl-D-erythritol kinase
MILFPNAKINIGLNIIEKRPDNYHNIESVFMPIPLCDVLEVVEAKETSLHLSGIPIDGDSNDNLIMKAYRLMQEQYDLPPVEIHLEKIIPFGAGIGGGSADAAFTIKALNDLFKLNLDAETLKKLAAKIGADCSFFINNQPSYVTGIGEILEPIELNLKGMFLVLVKPDDHISTKEAYANIHPQKPEISIKDTIRRPISEWRGNIQNDFEESVFPQHPKVADIKEKLYKLGADYASMTGSGSSVFGLFPEEVDIAEKFREEFYWCCRL